MEQETVLCGSCRSLKGDFLDWYKEKLLRIEISECLEFKNLLIARFTIVKSLFLPNVNLLKASDFSRDDFHETDQEQSHVLSMRVELQAISDGGAAVRVNRCFFLYGFI